MIAEAEIINANWQSDTREETPTPFTQRQTDLGEILIILPEMHAQYLIASQISRLLSNLGSGQAQTRGMAPSLEKMKSPTEERFHKLANQWYRETGMLSLIGQKAMHPAYQDIIGMGRDALPFIIGQLESNRGDWFWALRHIVGAENDPAEGKTSFREAREAWLNWAKKNPDFN